MTLSAEQLQLLYYLLPAIFIGFFFGYLLSRAFSKEKYEPKLATLSKKISGKNIKIEQASKQQIQLESHIANQATELLSSKKIIENKKEKIFELQDEMHRLTQGISKRDSLMNKFENRNQEQQKSEIISNSKE